MTVHNYTTYQSKTIMWEQKRISRLNLSAWLYKMMFKCIPIHSYHWFSMANKTCRKIYFICSLFISWIWLCSLVSLWCVKTANMHTRTPKSFSSRSVVENFSFFFTQSEYSPVGFSLSVSLFSSPLSSPLSFRFDITQCMASITHTQRMKKKEEEEGQYYVHAV